MRIGTQENQVNLNVVCGNGGVGTMSSGLFAVAYRETGSADFAVVAILALNMNENPGNTTHTVELKSQVELGMDGESETEASVGDRTMLVQSVKLPNSATY